MKETRPEAAGIRGVIFDLGNVLIRLRPIPLVDRTPGGAEMMVEGLTVEGLTVEGYTDPLSLLRTDPVLDRFERGRATQAEFFDAVRRLFSAELLDREIEAAYLAILGEPIPGMAEVVEELRDRGIRSVGLTDISPGHLQLVSRYPAVALLEQVIASCVTGHRKPEPGAYHAALAALGTSPGETLFIDDRPENTAGAAGLGLRTFVFTGAEELRTFLGLSPDGSPQRSQRDARGTQRSPVSE